MGFNYLLIKKKKESAFSSKTIYINHYEYLIEIVFNFFNFEKKIIIFDLHIGNTYKVIQLNNFSHNNILLNPSFD